MTNQALIDLLLLRVMQPPTGDTRKMVDMVRQGRPPPKYKYPGGLITSLPEHLRQQVHLLQASDWNRPWDAALWADNVCPTCLGYKPICKGLHIFPKKKSSR